MSRYGVHLQSLPAQTLTAALGGNTLTIELQWMARMGVFRVNILTAQEVMLTAGRYLQPGADLLSGLYPPPDTDYGSLILEGDEPTPDNLGVTNQLVWSDE